MFKFGQLVIIWFHLWNHCVGWDPPVFNQPLDTIRKMTPVDQVTIPLAAGRSASLPKSKGKKKTLLEKFPDLKFIIRECPQWLEWARAKDEAVTNADLRHTFDHILKHRRSEYEQAGIRNALPHKVSTWWFCKMKAAVGVKTFRYGQ